MLKHAKGNLLNMAEDGQFDIIVQGCNCWKAMGRGIAREIKQRYPYAAAADIHYHNLMKSLNGNYSMLGTYSRSIETKVVEYGVEVEFTIVNAYTQYNTSSEEDVFEYTAFELILQKLLKEYGKERIGLPYIGMGLACGDITRIIPMIEKFAEEVTKAGGEVTLVEFEA